jgi:hypothetical protein
MAVNDAFQSSEDGGVGRWVHAWPRRRCRGACLSCLADASFLLMLVQELIVQSLTVGRGRAQAAG